MPATFKLSKDQIASFSERGLLRVNFNLDPDFLDSIVEKITPYYDAEQLQQRAPGIRLQDIWKQVDEARQLATDRRILDALQQLIGRKPLPFQTLNFPVGTAQLTHSDTLHFSSIPKGYMLGVWVALEDIDADNGPLIYYPGSHKLKEYSMQNLGLKSGRENYPEYEKAIQRLIEVNNLKPEYGIIKKGEALIWHANLLHGGAPHKDRNRSRYSQVTHYYFEGCKYYTPMNSRFGFKLYRNPVWLPESADYELTDSLPAYSLFQRILLRLGILKDD